ncbi:MAG: ECF transporter S component [Anaerolineales bacterium]|nr:ECF transporter S component [Anaerolineales bacterium]
MTTSTKPVESSPFAFRYTTMDLVIMAVLAAAGAIISAWVINPLVRALNLGSPFLATWPGALHLLVVVLAGQIVKKPGAALTTGLINGLAQLLFGSSAGALALLYGLANGLGAEIGIAIAGWRSNLVSAMLSGAFGVACGFAVDLFYWFPNFTLFLQIAYVVNAWFAGLIVTGLATFGIRRALTRAGI